MTSNSTAAAVPEIDLPVRVDHAACVTLRPNIEAARGQPLDLNTEAVEFLGGAGAELLLVARTEWQAKSIEFRVLKPSQAFVQGLDRLSLPHSSLLEKDMA